MCSQCASWSIFFLPSTPWACECCFCAVKPLEGIRDQMEEFGDRSCATLNNHVQHQCTGLSSQWGQLKEKAVRPEVSASSFAIVSFCLLSFGSEIWRNRGNRECLAGALKSERLAAIQAGPFMRSTETIASGSRLVWRHPSGSTYSSPLLMLLELGQEEKKKCGGGSAELKRWRMGGSRGWHSLGKGGSA